jgi:hypothetical protein
MNKELKGREGERGKGRLKFVNSEALDAVKLRETP